MNNDKKTNGRNARLLETLERQVRDAIDASYLTGEKYPSGGRVCVPHDDPRSDLRDYVRNQTWCDKFDALIDRETKHERGHRRGAPNGWRFKFGAKHGARIVMLSQLGQGAQRTEAPAAASFITWRDTAAEAQLIGWLARVELAKVPGLLDALALLDYAAAGRDGDE
jgi:hypothetical protein